MLCLLLLLKRLPQLFHGNVCCYCNFLILKELFPSLSISVLVFLISFYANVVVAVIDVNICLSLTSIALFYVNCRWTSIFSDCCSVNLLRPDMECKAPENTFSSCEEMIKSKNLRYFMWILLLLIFGGNSFSLLLRLTTKDNQRVQNLFICSLSVSDMLMAVYIAVIMSKDLTFRGEYYRYDQEWRLSEECTLSGVVSILSSEVSVFTLVLIAYDRFLALVKVTSFKRITIRVAIVALILTWSICFAIAILPVIVYPYFNDYQEKTGFYGTNSLCLPLQLPGEGVVAWEYSLTIFGVLNFIAAVYLITAYVCIFHSSYKSAKLSRNEKRMESQPKLAKRLAAVVFTDVCCWVPVAILLFLSLGRAVSDSDNNLYSWFSICVIPINSAINPILYTLGTNFFWDKIKNYWRKVASCCRRGEWVHALKK